MRPAGRTRPTPASPLPALISAPPAPRSGLQVGRQWGRSLALAPAAGAVGRQRRPPRPPQGCSPHRQPPRSRPAAIRLRRSLSRVRGPASPTLRGSPAAQGRSAVRGTPRGCGPQRFRLRLPRGAIRVSCGPLLPSHFSGGRARSAAPHVCPAALWPCPCIAPVSSLGRASQRLRRAAVAAVPLRPRQIQRGGDCAARFKAGGGGWGGASSKAKPPGPGRGGKPSTQRPGARQRPGHRSRCRRSASAPRRLRPCSSPPPGRRESPATTSPGIARMDTPRTRTNENSGRPQVTRWTCAPARTLRSHPPIAATGHRPHRRRAAAMPPKPALSRNPVKSPRSKQWSPTPHKHCLKPRRPSCHIWGVPAAML